MTGSAWGPASLRARLFLALALIFLLGAAGMDLLRRAQSDSPEELLEQTSLRSEARLVARALRFDLTGRLAAVALPAPWRRAYATAEFSTYTVLSPTGEPEARSPNLPAPQTAPVSDARPNEPHGQQGLILSTTPLRLTHGGAAAMLATPAPRGRTVVVERPNPGGADENSAPLDDYAPTLLFGALAILAVGAAWLVAAWSLRPLDRAARELAQVGPDRPDARLSGEGLPTELAPLAREVNTALDRVGAAYAAQARFTADAAHALRTPLSVLDLRLQRAQAGAPLDWPTVRADLAQLKQVVSALLALTRAERGAAERAAEYVALGRLVRESAAALAPAAEALGRALEVEDGSDAVAVRVDPLELRDMIGALVDNALTHGAGRVLLSVACDGPAAVLRVSDEGGGVPEGAREAVFERFHKLRGASPGAGLGLSIVRRTARNAGGEARLVEAATVEVRLPASQSAPPSG